MRKSVLVFGTISGIISAIWVCVAMNMMDHCNPEDMATGMLLGYASMLVANIFLFIGVRNYRDKFNQGVITFGKALGVGLLIALVAATFYVVSWEIYYFGTDSNFMDVFREAQLKMWESSAMTEAQVAMELKKFDEFAVLYQNPFFNAAVTYMEILPMGILCALITAIIVRRKTKKEPKVETITESDDTPMLS